jgi:hypothetical protein
MMCIQHRNNTNGFTLTELRHMVAALRKHDVRELPAEFEASLDERIKTKLRKELEENK